MKRRTKLGLGITALSASVLLLSGCTASFCSTKDQSNMLYAFDDGITRYYDADNKPEGAIQHAYFTNVYYTVSMDNANPGLISILDTCKTNNIETPHVDYWATMDALLLDDVKSNAYAGLNADASATKVNEALSKHGYLKFYSDKENPTTWDNWDKYNKQTYSLIDIDKCPTNDFITQYKKSMNSYISSYRSCIATDDGQYGSYGANNDVKHTIAIEAKTYQYAWSKGFFEGLLVWPIAAFVDILCNSFSGLGTGLNGTVGWAQILAIFIVTVVVRSFMFLVSFKSTLSNAKMSELQPQIAKIQNKYPNANTNQAERARMSQEMSALYKKNGINPLSSLLIMVVQFPIFICVWGALTGSAWLSTGSFLNLNLSDSISATLFNGANWATGAAETALVLFLLMAAAQAAAMLLPQWIQKRKQKDVAKLAKNPNQNSQNRNMKIFTYVMMGMIIIMGFSLASAMGIYWFFGALFSIAQTLITQAILSRRKAKK